MAHEKSSRSLIFTEKEVRWSKAPISCAMDVNRFENNSSCAASGLGICSDSTFVITPLFVIIVFPAISISAAQPFIIEVVLVRLPMIAGPVIRAPGLNSDW